MIRLSPSLSSSLLSSGLDHTQHHNGLIAHALIKLTNKSANSKLFDSYGISNHNGSLGEITIKTNQGELNLSMKKFIKYTQNKCNTCGDTDICYDNPFRFGIEFLGTT